MKLPLPIYDFFRNGMAVDHEEKKKCRRGTTFSGSLDTDGEQGFMRRASFCYRVLLKKQLDGSVVFIVECWICPPYSPDTKDYVQNYEQKIFDGTQESMELVEEWLLERHDSLIG